MSLRSATFDGTWKQTSETAVDLRVCECCSTTVAVTADGPITAFRDRSDKDVRDIGVSRLENNAWTAAQIVHNDGWTIPACPVNGPMLSARESQCRGRLVHGAETNRARLRSMLERCRPHMGRPPNQAG
jgi:hypothetical protein